ncbi:MAG: TIGR04282 family arsenosugar biosynthesis glycosyltransferase [Dehalococcoidia bacterium]
MPDEAVAVVLTRVPIAGQTKSRLARDIGEKAAFRLAEAFLVDTLALCGRAGLTPLIAFTPAGAEAALEPIAPGVARVPQGEGDLGARILGALGEGLGRAGAAVLIGSDSPDLPADELRRALDLLERHDVVLGPAEDGGFVLIAARRRLPAELFAGVHWSTSTVLREVLANAKGLGLDVGLTEPWSDVDDLESLLALRARDAAHGRCPATAAALAALRLPEAAYA